MRCGGTQRQVVTIGRPPHGPQGDPSSGSSCPGRTPPPRLLPVLFPLRHGRSGVHFPDLPSGAAAVAPASPNSESPSPPQPLPLWEGTAPTPAPAASAPASPRSALTPEQTRPPEALSGLTAAAALPPSPPTSTHSARPDSSTFSAGNPWQPRGWAPTPLLPSLVPELRVCSPATEAASWGRDSGGGSISLALQLPDAHDLRLRPAPNPPPSLVREPAGPAPPAGLSDAP